MAIKTGSISSSFLHSTTETIGYYLKYFSDYDYMCSTNNNQSATCFLYGYDFRRLSNYTNVVITDIKATVTGKKNGSSSYYSMSIRPITDFKIDNSYNETSASTDYTSMITLTMGFTKYITTTTSTSYTRSFSSTEDLSPFVSWANENLDKLIGGYNSNSFGVRAYVRQGYIYDVVLTVEFTYEEIEYVTVTTEVSPAGAGTVTPTHQVESGTTATVSAIPNTGYKFSHWLINGADSGVTSTTLSGTVDSDLTVTAVFVLDKINKIYVGTAQPKAIYVGTQEVKAIYVGTTKVYG